MDSLENELKELKAFIGDLKADRQAQKEKEKRDSWTKYVSMSLVFVAVLAAIATQWSGKYSSRVLVNLNDSTFNQAMASDTWNEFQANSIKQNLYETLGELEPPGVSTNAADADKREAAFKSKIEKYAANKDKKSKEAKDLEAKRDSLRALATDASRHGSGMGSAVSIYQIAVAMGSICLVTKRKWLWYVSLLLAAGATVKMFMVWLN